jgi:hypothetical protein
VLKNCLWESKVIGKEGLDVGGRLIIKYTLEENMMGCYELELSGPE